MGAKNQADASVDFSGFQGPSHTESASRAGPFPIHLPPRKFVQNRMAQTCSLDRTARSGSSMAQPGRFFFHNGFAGLR